MRVFVTGASGWIGSAVVPELLAAGHPVSALARSDSSAAALVGAGVEVHRGTLDDLEVLKGAAAAADGVIHLAFKHDLAFAGDFQVAAEADRRVVDAFGDALAGTDKRFVIASGTLGVAPPGQVATERDFPVTHGSGPQTRQATATATLSLASRRVRSAVVRLPPSVHGEGDYGFMAMLVRIAQDKGVSGYVAEGNNRWPAVHRLDAARIFRLAIENATAGSALHAVADEGVPVRSIAEVIGRHLRIPVAAVIPDDAAQHFGWLGSFFAMDGPTSSELTRRLLPWRPAQLGLIADLNQGHYFGNSAGAKRAEPLERP